MEGGGDGRAEDGGRPSCHTKRVVELMTCLFFHFGPLQYVHNFLAQTLTIDNLYIKNLNFVVIF